MAYDLFDASLYDNLEDAHQKLTLLRLQAEREAYDPDSTLCAQHIAQALEVVDWLDKALTTIDIAITDKLPASEFVRLWRRNGLDDRGMP